MPQISKLRIVNFQYNDGHRLIADELYNFESDDKGPVDVLINLANGGGKSVLVQLMMQPIIPRAKVAGRRIESFFKKASDHCYIVIEWALENSKMKLMTGIAMAASESAAAETENDRGAQVRYYTFISSYQNYQGEYNIIHLPLSKKENGKFVPAAFDDIRNLAKKSNGALTRYASDDSVKWQERLSQYGIIQNEWRMIEELNSNEDGLSKYFSDLRTSDAVIDKLIIPRIEEKLHRVTSKEDSSLETMLITYAKQYSRQKEILRERDVCWGFHSMLEQTKVQADELLNSNDLLESCIEKLFAYGDALHQEIDRESKQEEELLVQQEEQENNIFHIKWEKISAEYYACKQVFEEKCAILQMAEQNRIAAHEQADLAQKALLLIECAHYYQQLQAIENKIEAITTEITRRENDSNSKQELASLKYSALVAIEFELNSIVPELNAMKEKHRNLLQEKSQKSDELRQLQKKITTTRTEVDKADAALTAECDESDRLVQKLNIDACRMLDGNYREEELQLWKNRQKKQAENIALDIKATQTHIDELEERRECIPEEIVDIRSEMGKRQDARNKTEQLLEEYHRKEEALKGICERHGLDFELRFTPSVKNYLMEQIARNKGEVDDESRKTEATEEAIAAVKRGSLHIPKLLQNYLDSTGVHYTTVEKYLLAQKEKGTISGIQCSELLAKYPYAAYGVIVSERDMTNLYPDDSELWLPSILPVFTPEGIEQMMQGREQSLNAIAAYSQEYFADSGAYAEKLNLNLIRQKERQNYLRSVGNQLQEDTDVIEEFAEYDIGWQERTQTQFEILTRAITSQQEELNRLEEEKKSIRQSIQRARSLVDSLKIQQREITQLLSDFDELMERLSNEVRLCNELAQKRKQLQSLMREEQQITEQIAAAENTAEKLKRELDVRDEARRALESGKRAVSGAEKAKVISGQWYALLEQYKRLSEAQNEDIKRLMEDKLRLVKEGDEKTQEIRKRKCDPQDYENVMYSEAIENSARERLEETKVICGKADENYLSTSRVHAKAESALETVSGSLRDYGGAALPMSEIGHSFDTRITEAEKKLFEIRKVMKRVSERIKQLQVTKGRLDNATENYTRPVSVHTIQLEEDCNKQLAVIIKEITEWKRAVDSFHQEVAGMLRKIADTYGNASEDVKHATNSMQGLLSNNTIRGDRYYTLCEHIDTNIHTVQLRISQIETDLKEFNKTKGDLVHQCLIQGRQMYEGLMQLSNNSKVTVQGKRHQMIRFDIPATIDDNVAMGAVTAEIDKGTEEIVAVLAKDAYAESELQKIAGRTVGSKRLLRKYIGADHIILKAYKIDRNPDNSGYRTWEHTQVQNSGAEKFVVYFAVILGLMAYTRDDGMSLDWNKNRSVLVLDNPFGPISSKHVLEPMFEISKNYNVQMICLSDISKADIVSCFDLVIRAIVKKFAFSNKEQLTHEENEEIEHGFYQVSQVKLL